jgi:CheY-like chemotaxis protein
MRRGRIEVSGADPLAAKDDAASRRVLVRVLGRRDQGVTAAGGAEALARWRERGAGALVTDLRMPTFAGGEPAALRSEGPAPAAVVTAPMDPGSEEGLASPGSAAPVILTKPVGANRLLSWTLLR